ncbi:hypothetical protein FS837_001197, partial [Tulasnella sp. UAMH 9824]
MAFHSLDQLNHDRINLFRIVDNLEPAVLSDSFLPKGSDRHSAWLKATSTQTTIQHALELLNKVKESAVGGSYDDIKHTLDRMQVVVESARARLEKTPPRPPSLLASMKLPRSAPPKRRTESQAVLPEAELLLDEVEKSPAPRQSPPPSLSPLEWSASPSSEAPEQSTQAAHSERPPPYESRPNPPSRKPTLPAQPAFLTTSLETQEELAEQLALMGRQLKLNALHLANSISKEKGVLDDAGEKLERNLDTMTKER